MAERTSADAMLEFWQRQVEAGTKAWLDAIGRGESADPSRGWRPFVDQSIAAWASVMAQGPVSPEMMAQWRKFLDQWIAAWGEALEKAMATEAFGRALGQYLEQWVGAQAPVRKAAAEVSATVLEALGLPSRADVAALTRLAADLDDRLERVEDQLQAITARLAPAPTSRAASPARRRTPSSRPRRRRR